MEIFLTSRAQIMILECPSTFAGTPAWAKDGRERLRTQLRRSCDTDIATLRAAVVGIPTTKSRAFIGSPSSAEVTLKCRPSSPGGPNGLPGPQL